MGKSLHASLPNLRLLPLGIMSPGLSGEMAPDYETHSLWGPAARRENLCIDDVLESKILTTGPEDSVEIQIMNPRTIIDKYENKPPH